MVYQNYLDQARIAAANRIGLRWGTPDELNRVNQAGFAAGVTSPLSFGAPRQSDFLKVTSRVTQPARMHTSTGFGDFGRTTIEGEQRAYDYSYDTAGFSGALAGWMRSSGRYKDWADADIQAFAAETADMTPEQRAARELQEGNRIAWDKANEEAKADRARMLGELEAFKANYGETRINDALSREKAYWDARTSQILDRTQKQFVNMGRVASPYLLGELGRRLTAQAADALQVRRFEYERENQQMQQYYLSTLNNVLQNTERKVMDPMQAAALTKQIGQSSSTEFAAAA